MMTKCEFAEKYGIIRPDVHAAVRMAELESLPEMKKTGRRYANLYYEKDLAKAVIEYYREKRKYYIRKANDWAGRANAIAEKYREGQEDG